MRFFSLYPGGLGRKFFQNVQDSGFKESVEQYYNKVLISVFALTVIVGAFFFFLSVPLYYLVLVFFFWAAFFYFKVSLRASSRIKKMERVFPDVISLMASNLRAGITIDRAFLLAARKEFAPLDEKIKHAGREISTGQDVVQALRNLGDSIHSEKISKVINLIISGIRAGGNMADLLEQTSSNMKDKELVEKKASSSIIMYVVFIVVAVAVGAPILFGLSTILVEIIFNLSARVPDVATSQINMPFTFSRLAISPDFVLYFSVLFLIATNLISSLLIGLVNKGDSKSGLKYFLPMVSTSLALFFLIRAFLSKFLVATIQSY